MMPSVLSIHLKRQETYVRMLYIDYSLVFNTLVHSWSTQVHRLDSKLLDLDLSQPICMWIRVFALNRSVRLFPHLTPSLTSVMQK